MTPRPGSRVYLDHASTSPLRPAAREAMMQWLDSSSSTWADPSRVHTDARQVRAALEEAREQVAQLFGTRPRQVVFTSGGTEAVNAATFGACRARPGRAVLCPTVEHSAVRESSARWAPDVVTAGVDRSARLDLDQVQSVLTRGGVGLVQCQLANHEVGTRQPVAEIVEVAHRHGALVHVDAVAGAGWIPIGFDELGADLLSVSAHRLGGPPGIGAMLERRGLRVEPFVVGGAQERARRGGLENVPAAAGFGAMAGELARPGVLAAEVAAAQARTDELRRLISSMAGVEIFGPPDAADRLANLVCLGLSGVQAEPVLIGLDQAGIAAHSGSSCSSEELEPSPVLAAMGVDAEHSLRFSVGWSTGPDDVPRAATALADVLERLRRLRG